ncbi:MAG: chromosomal replication initiator DnaA [Mangrovicoccus sp.]
MICDEQYLLDLPIADNLGRGDFHAAPCNATALAMIEAPQSWGGVPHLLIGPKGSGKTHLAHIFMQACEGRIRQALDLTEALLADEDQPRPLVVENCDRIGGQKLREEILFHLYNRYKATQAPLLITASRELRDWGLTLPDLASRLGACLRLTLNPPDDDTLRAVMAKLCVDRQLAVRPETLDYLVIRIDRSFAVAREIILALDELSLRSQRPPSKKLAGDVLKMYDSGQLGPLPAYGDLK